MKKFNQILKEVSIHLNEEVHDHEAIADHFLTTDEGKELHSEVKEILKKDLETE